MFFYFCLFNELWHMWKRFFFKFCERISRTANGNPSMRSIMITSFVGDDELGSIVSNPYLFNVHEVLLYFFLLAEILRYNFVMIWRCRIVFCFVIKREKQRSTQKHIFLFFKRLMRYMLERHTHTHKLERCCWHLLNLSSFRIKQIFVQ